MNNPMEWTRWTFTDGEGKEREIFMPGPESTQEEVEVFWGLLKHAQEVFEPDDFAAGDALGLGAAGLAAAAVVEELFRRWVEEMKARSSPPRKEAAHYDVFEEEGEVVVRLRPDGFDFEAAIDAQQKLIVDSFDVEDATRYIVTHSWAWTWMEWEAPRVDTSDTMEERVMQATRLYANHIASACLEVTEQHLLAEAKTQEGRLYQLERFLHVREGGWAEINFGEINREEIRACVREHLQRLEIDKVEELNQTVRKREHEAVEVSRWDTAAQLRTTREMIQHELTKILAGATTSSPRKSISVSDQKSSGRGRQKEYDEDALEKAVWSVLEEQPEDCWHRSGQRKGKPNYSGIFNAINESPDHTSCLLKERGPRRGELLGFRQGQKVIKEILKANPERIEELRRSLK